MNSKASSTYVKEGSHASSGKRTYSSLQDDKSGYSGNTLQASPQRPTGAPNTRHDPYRLSTIMGGDEEETVIELRPVTHTYQVDLEHDGKDVKDSWVQSEAERSPTMVRVTSEPATDDAASNKTILDRK